MLGCTRRRRGRMTSPWLRVATTSAYHVPGSQRAGASTASQRVACASHHRCPAAAHHDGECVDLQVRERQRQAASCAHHVAGSQPAGASTASQRQGRTPRLRATTAHAGCASQACRLSKLHSTAGVASILSSPALLTVLPLMLMQCSYTAFAIAATATWPLGLCKPRGWPPRPSMNSGSDVF